MSELPINQVINSDCLEFIKTLPDNCIDLIVTGKRLRKTVVQKGYKTQKRLF